MNPPVAVAAVPSLANLYRSIWRFAAGARVTMLASTVLLAGSTAVRLALPWMAAQAINSLQNGGTDSVGGAALWVVAILAVYVAAWLLVAVYVWQARGRGEALLMGSVFMIYTYAQQAGGVIGSMAANFQGFARARTDYASAPAETSAAASGG